MASPPDARGLPRRAKLKKILRVGIVGALVIGIGIQFVPVEGIGHNPPERHVPEAPAEVKAILRGSCMDCHSHETLWPWYARLAPGSWLMARDVRRARAHFNISEWGGLGESYRQVDKENAVEQIEAGDVPHGQRGIPTNPLGLGEQEGRFSGAGCWQASRTVGIKS